MGITNSPSVNSQSKTRIAVNALDANQSHLSNACDFAQRPSATIYPYLLKDLILCRSNQAFMVDITYLRLGNQFVYLIALIDVYSRFVAGWYLSDALNAESCIKAFYRALKTGLPEIINSDQGSQFTSELWTSTLTTCNIKISMTGQGRCIDNVFMNVFGVASNTKQFILMNLMILMH